jgi:hypothetical protein
LVRFDSLLGYRVYPLLPSNCRLFWFSCHSIQHGWFITEWIYHIKLI